MLAEWKDTTELDREESALSQFNVAKAILDYPEAIVLDESICEDLSVNTTAQRLRASSLKEALSAFPAKELPENYSELNENQKKVLFTHGGALTLLLLEKITHIYKAFHDGNQCRTLIDLGSKSFANVLRPREEITIAFAKRAASLAKKNHVLIVYGAFHQFEDANNILFMKPINTLPTDESTSIEGAAVKRILDSLKENPDDILGRYTNAILCYVSKYYETAFEDCCHIILLPEKNWRSVRNDVFTPTIAATIDLAKNCENKINKIAKNYYDKRNYDLALQKFQLLNKLRPSENYADMIKKCSHFLETKKCLEKKSELTSSGLSIFTQSQANTPLKEFGTQPSSLEIPQK